MTKTSLHGVTRLTDVGLIRVQGDDAAKFLHGQLTQDFVLLGMAQARLAAFCNAKGRMQASFIGFKRSATDILLVCSQDVLAPTLKRLSLFVMRAKARLSDASAEFDVYGLAGETCIQAIQTTAVKLDDIWAKADFESQTLVRLYPADGVPRGLWVTPVGSASPAGPAMANELWAWSEVRSAIATITAPVVEIFVPQMLNYESVGGVNFKKGCYPGQEVVARSQFRGTLKRRAYLAHCTTLLQAGEPLFVPDEASQPCGSVVQAAAAPTGGFDAIVSMQISAFEADQVHLGSVGGPRLNLTAPPYELLADV
ncbi:MAG: folate-binding protein YgfZ [Rhodoferax sp.]|uniref:CAF17-like 4Fe-4S cluster assembly/insertion protein YgfZ n=1 Tax=Rhodoferax sp. TaxID=50421 RepID=UPI001B4F66A9|nr:folate-binding protein [Rhodoferax sp.]MBP9907385.1 folate-binding protein YgfZ [Rhodoferax sp.]